MFVEDAILLAYSVTIISEVFIILLLQRPKKIWQWIVGVFLVNSLTHPCAIYFIHVQDSSYWLVEFSVFLVEMFWYKMAFGLSWRRSIIVSGIANIFSILVGICVRIFLNLR